MLRAVSLPPARPGLRTPWRRLALAAALATSTGCIAANPLLSGGETTPQGRVDVAAGGTARLPTGQLREVAFARGDQAVQRSALGEGSTPMAVARYGVNLHTDFEVAVVGASARLSYRHEWLLADGINRTVWLLTPSFLLGKAYDRDSDPARGGVRASVELPFLYSADYGGVYETWVGPRVGADYVTGDFRVEGGAAAEVRAMGLRAGAVLGFGAGFRRIHAMIELSAVYEHWWLSAGGQRRQRGGVVLIPAFALRVRL
jgi:hypothetical protein